MKAIAISLLAAAINVQPLINEEFLEPSIQNEVDHAISRAPTNMPETAVSADFGTNGLNRSAIAIKLVSTQKSSGRWFIGTNDVTAAAIRILRSL